MQVDPEKRRAINDLYSQRFSKRQTQNRLYYGQRPQRDSSLSKIVKIDRSVLTEKKRRR
jgi:hypothetical protein